MVYYAGIGSRETPSGIIALFERVAAYLAQQGFVLRSGHADGADIAFEKGCDKAGGKKEIYLPWVGFNGSSSNLIVKDKRAFEIAEKFHPYWNNLKAGATKLHARNTHQILGRDFDTPSAFVLCWTKDGAKIGGTAQAIRIAERYGVSVCNVGRCDDVNAARAVIRGFLGLPKEN